MSVEENRHEFDSQNGRAERREVRMSALHQVVPMFLLIQFVVVLVALVSAMVLADRQYSIPARKSSRNAVTKLV
jgi:hypothetical protein